MGVHIVTRGTFRGDCCNAQCAIVQTVVLAESSSEGLSSSGFHPLFQNRVIFISYPFCFYSVHTACVSTGMPSGVGARLRLIFRTYTIYCTTYCIAKRARRMLCDTRCTRAWWCGKLYPSQHLAVPGAGHTNPRRKRLLPPKYTRRNNKESEVVCGASLDHCQDS